MLKLARQSEPVLLSNASKKKLENKSKNGLRNDNSIQTEVPLCFI